MPIDECATHADISLNQSLPMTLLKEATAVAVVVTVLRNQLTALSPSLKIICMFLA